MTPWNPSARASPAIVAATLVLLAGCQPSEALIPPPVSQQVNDDGREHTYDTAWQNIRKLNADIQAGDVSGLAKDSLFIASQMDRLESGRAGSLGNRHTAELVELVAAETASRTTDANRQAIASAAQSLQDSFDFGNFATARDFALEVHVIARDSAG
jgi:enamine deaminase RidA (YjgF/YER057c/UK114 family)